MKKTAGHRILKILWDGNFHYTHELFDSQNQQYNARIFGLRAKGIVIKSEKNEKDCNGYRLITPTRKIDFVNKCLNAQQELL